MGRIRPLPPVEDLRQALSYDPATGDLVFRESRGSKGAGQKAGRVDFHGYVVFRVFGRMVKAHRIAWVMHYSEDPGDMFVDHINGDKTDNRICNLRLATLEQNAMNARRQERNKTGHKGVYWDARRRRYKVSFRQKHVAFTKTLDEAIAIYRRLALEFGGDFARFD